MTMTKKTITRCLSSLKECHKDFVEAGCLISLQAQVNAIQIFCRFRVHRDVDAQVPDNMNTPTSLDT